MSKIKKFNIPIFYGTLIIIKTKDLSSCAREFNLNMGEDDVYDAVTFKKVNKKGIINYYVIFNNTDPAIICHESLHVSHLILNSCGIILDSKNDEIQAYLTGWIFNKIYKHLNKK